MPKTARTRRTPPLAMIAIAVAFALAATIAFLLYDSNRPRVLDDPDLAQAAPAAADQGRAVP